MSCGCGEIARASSYFRQRLILSQDVYVSTILYLLALTFAKASVVLFLGRLVARRAHSIAVLVLVACTVAWSLASIFGVSFQCELPQPWDLVHAQCFDVVSVWTVNLVQSSRN